MQTSSINLDTVLQARERLRHGLHLTRCGHSAALSQLTGMSMIVKHDYEQVTGSFKERGARHALLCLNPEQRAAGVIAASAGNHALGLAYHGQALGISVLVVMPESAPRVKVDRCRHYGAEVVLHGRDFDHAAAFAHQLARQTGRKFVHPFDDPQVIAGQGTLGLEVMDQTLGEFDAILVPVGGGGLLAGVATVVKALAPSTEIIAVEPAHAPCFAVARGAGRPVAVPVCATLADGLAVSVTGENAFALAAEKVDRAVTVSEDELARGIFELAEKENCFVEGAAAAGLAACVAGKLDYLRGRRVVLLLTGRNIDPAAHERALWRGWTERELEAENRSALTATMSHL